MNKLEYINYSDTYDMATPYKVYRRKFQMATGELVKLKLMYHGKIETFKLNQAMNYKNPMFICIYTWKHKIRRL